VGLQLHMPLVSELWAEPSSFDSKPKMTSLPSQPDSPEVCTRLWPPINWNAAPHIILHRKISARACIKYIFLSHWSGEGSIQSAIMQFLVLTQTQWRLLHTIW
jgi:hypothetical protein